MKIELTYERAQSLYNLLELLIDNYRPTNIAELLIDDIIKEVFEKLRKKLCNRYTKDYSLKLNPKEQKAYYIFFNQNKISIGWEYEQLMVQSHINLIDQIYA